ncbi:radial spoke head protein 9 homolog isoform X2 [Harpia harpyja]|uniref:radial spoke head protein 9 homolog isoform X2 n=1 Tax=Harpia harpyja TaxID=202280 RepID=UPI0022B20AA5|nr:radial spoke head protein 9 homolog isoform X2 [Harpia harpyja]
MEAASLPAALELAAGGGAGLSPEKRAVLGASLLLLQRDYRFERVWFWGCIQGVRGAYYIAEGLGPDRAAPRSRLYSLNCVGWSLLPPATEEMVAQAEQLKGRFQGDPSFEYEHIEINAEDAERLFEDGLSLMEAKKLSSYFHFTEPFNLKNKTLLEKADLDPSTDFLDSLEHDIPQGSWTVQLEKGDTVVVLRSLLWLGLTFYHVPMTKQYGYVYFGTGEKNFDLPFML